jgi:hypothetical protein
LTGTRELLRLANRVYAYVALLNDDYPSTDEQQYLRRGLGYPDAKEGLNRWLPLAKWFLAIPYHVVLFFLYIGAVFALIAAWFAILFTGRYHGACSTTSWASCAGTTASLPTPSCSCS